MELKHRDFFGDNGVTSTSANHIANMAKEFYQYAEVEMEMLNFITTDAKLLGDEKSTVIKRGVNPIDFAKIKTTLEDISLCKRLIAYLREAIKEKKRLYEEAKEMVFVDPEEIPTPVLPKYLTEEDILAGWSKNKLEKYLSLEAKVSTLGKAIHPDGPFSRARKQLAKLEPIQYKENGRDTFIYNNSPSIPYDEVDSMFTSLQAEHRKTQAELNGMKHEIELILREDKLAKDQKYEQQRANYMAIQEKYLADNNIRRQKLCAEVEALKIVIPDELKPIHDKIMKES